MEERRLLYVGITRAMDRLYLVCAQNRSSYGYAEPADPSRFLADLPEELINEDQPARYANNARSRGGIYPQRSTSGDLYRQTLPSRPDRWQPSARSTPPPVPGAAGTEHRGGQAGEPNRRYQPGMRVNHASWGEGMVLKSNLQDDDEIVDVFFAGIGLKRVMASLARLEIIYK